MMEMENFYKLSEIKEKFELETDPDVKELYLSISNVRSFN